MGPVLLRHILTKKASVSAVDTLTTRIAQLEKAGPGDKKQTDKYMKTKQAQQAKVDKLEQQVKKFKMADATTSPAAHKNHCDARAGVLLVSSTSS